MSRIPLALVVLAAVLPAGASAQCADGSPPPCRAPRVARPVVPHTPAVVRVDSAGQQILTVKYDAVPVLDVIRELAPLVRRSIAVSAVAESVAVSGRVQDRPWNAALRELLKAKGMDAVEDEPGGWLTVRTNAELRGRTRSVAAAPDTTSRIIASAIALFEQFNLEKALPLFRQVVAPTYPFPLSRSQRVTAFKYIGAAYSVLALKDSAVAAMLEAADLDPFVDLNPREFSQAELESFHEARSRILRVALGPIATATEPAMPAKPLSVFRVVLTQRARLTLTLISVADSTLRATLIDDVMPARQMVHPWLGTIRGEPAKAGVYELRVTARSSVTDRTDVARQYFRLAYGRDATGARVVMLNPMRLEP